ncbi:MAG: hypothetical protein QOI24_825 [Acidobacteriota bacterium]|jgi:hypothetical protein|nr:hypothetical protein [Acidobacteriota bacterium]
MEAGRAEAVSAWWRSLARAPESLTFAQRGMLLAATLVAALSRLLALAGSPWDWDEVLFELAMQRYDVAQHRPHPPGFPLFILAADAIRAVTGWSGFHSLQTLNFLAAIAIVPAMFFFCRELRMQFTTALSASLLLAFMPNVWFFGGTAFSDVPSMTLVIAGIALLLRGCRDDDVSLLAGAVVVGIAAGFRPQNLIVAFAPFLIAASHQWHRSKLRVVIAAASIALIVAISFGGAAAITGFPAYREALAKHQRYITAIDSFRSPTRPPLWRVADDFFVRPYRALPINVIVTLLAALALIRIRPPAAAALAAFGPFSLFAWLILDFHSTSRFSIGYIPLVAILAAEGIAIATARLPRGEPIAAAIVLVLFAGWTLPSLQLVRTTDAPPVAAIEYVRTHIDPHRAIALIDAELVPYAERALDGFETRYVSGSGAVWGAPYRRGVLVREGRSADRNAIVFHRERRHLAGIARDRYFDVSVIPLRENVEFGEGWSDEEDSVRSMANRSVTMLPPVPHATLELSFSATEPATVTIAFNGRVLDKIRATGLVTRRYLDVDDSRGVLLITTDHALRLHSLGWLPESHPER